jgi:putative oxidoreductase
VPTSIANLAIVAGRVLLASLFILAGVNKMLNYQPTLQFMEQSGLAPAQLLLPLAIMLEFGGGCIVALGHRFMPIAAIGLAVFTLVTNFVFHAFWAISGPESALQLSLFFKNVAVMGALIYVGGTGVKQSDQ